MKKFLIAEAEKARILGMHYNAMGKKLIKEGNEYRMTPEETKATGLTSVIEPDEYRFDAGGFNIFFDTDKFEMRDKTLYYDCIQDPRDKDDPPAGTMYDEMNNRLTAAQAGLKGPYMNIFRKYCKTAYNWLADYNAKNAPQPQVAAATTAKVTAPNPNSDAQSMADTQKRQADAKAKRDQANIDLKTLMSSPSGFLRYTDSNGELITDKTTLDTQAKELSRVLTNGAVIEDRIDKQDLIRSMRNLVRNFPEYGESPYFFNSYITELIG